MVHVRSLTAVLTTVLAATVMFVAGVAEGAGCGPEVLGTSRTLTLPREGAAYGKMQHEALKLNPGEVVLTFDDGPRAETTPAVLKALKDQCAKATFFMVGNHITKSPDLARQVAAEGHSTGLHSISHANQSQLSPEAQIEDLNQNQAAYRNVFGVDAPAYRFPFLAESPTLLAELKARKITVMSIDLGIEDWHVEDTTEILNRRLIDNLKTSGSGIILMHDANAPTAVALPVLLKTLKDGGYKVVHIQWRPPE